MSPARYFTAEILNDTVQELFPLSFCVNVIGESNFDQDSSRWRSVLTTPTH